MKDFFLPLSHGSSRVRGIKLGLHVCDTVYSEFPADLELYPDFTSEHFRTFQYLIMIN